MNTAYLESIQKRDIDEAERLARRLLKAHRNEPWFEHATAVLEYEIGNFGRLEQGK